MIHVISLGAGVQSSTMALMAAHGEIEPMPDAAIFADTQCEPESVYRWLDWLEKELPFPVYRVTRGNLGDDFLKALEKTNGRCGQPPFFVKGNSDGMLWRGCTQEYKIQPIKKKARELMKAAKSKTVTQWIGISLDEAHRMFPSNVKYITHMFPLLDLRLRRSDCLEWMEAHDYPRPPKSACRFCPYMSDGRWKRLKEDEPKEFELACQFDEAIRNAQGTKPRGAIINGQLFVHRSLAPLRDAVLTDSELGQGSLFGNECKGMCGV